MDALHISFHSGHINPKGKKVKSRTWLCFRERKPKWFHFLILCGATSLSLITTLQFLRIFSLATD